MEQTFNFLIKGEQQTINTKRVHGELENLFISVNKPVRITISLKDYPQIILFSDVNFTGTEIIPLRCDAINNKHERFHYGLSKLYLNDELSINIKAPTMTKGTIKIRWTDAS